MQFLLFEKPKKRVSQQVLDGKLLVKISNPWEIRIVFFFFVKKIVKLKGGLARMLTNFHEFFEVFPKLAGTPGTF